MKKLFGFGDKPAAPSPQQAAAVKKELDAHKIALAADKMEAYITSSDAKIEKLTKENELIKEKIIGLIKIGKKDVAKRFLLKKKKNEELMASIQKRTIAMQGYLTGFESMKESQEFAQTLALANGALQANKQNMDQAQEVLQEAREMKQESQMRAHEINELLNQELEEDDEDMDEMMKYYEQEVANDLLKQHEKAMPSKPAEQKAVQKPATAAPAKKDDFNDMLGKLLAN